MEAAAVTTRRALACDYPSYSNCTPIWVAFLIIFIIILFLFSLLICACARRKQRERARLALNQKNAAQTNAYGQSNMYSGAPQPVYGQGLQAVQAAQGVQVQAVAIPVAEAVPVSSV
jgi:hypothetical protein